MARQKEGNTLKTCIPTLFISNTLNTTGHIKYGPITMY